MFSTKSKPVYFDLEFERQKPKNNQSNSTKTRRNVSIQACMRLKKKKTVVFTITYTLKKIINNNLPQCFKGKTFCFWCLPSSSGTCGSVAVLSASMVTHDPAGVGYRDGTTPVSFTASSVL